MRLAHHNIGGGRKVRFARARARAALLLLTARRPAVICLNEAKDLQHSRRVARRYRAYGTRDVAVLVRRDLTVHHARVVEVSPPVPTPSSRGWGHARPAAVVTLTGPRVGKVTVICTHLTPSRNAEGHAARAAGVQSLVELVDTYSPDGPVVVAVDTNGAPQSLPKLHDALHWYVAGRHRIDWIGWTDDLYAVRTRNFGLSGSDHPARLVRLARRTGS